MIKFLLLFLIIIFYYFYNYNNYKRYKTGKTNFCILLTSCVRTKDPNDKRLFYYKRAIHHWLTYTSLPIFLVESSNYTFPEFKNTRLKVCSFNLEGLQSSTQYEAQSILYAMNFFKNEMKPYTHIIKITGRYYIPGLEKQLLFIPDADMLLQSRFHENFQHSEIFGFKKELTNDIFETLTKASHPMMEKRLYDLSKHRQYTRFHPFLNIFKVERGGDKMMLEYL